jgi:hypothetical protein
MSMFQVFDKFRQPIFVLIAGSILLALAFGIRHSFGIFLIPISEKNLFGNLLLEEFLTRLELVLSYLLAAFFIR